MKYKDTGFCKCDCCEKEDGRETLHWSEQNFDLCFECLNNLFVEYIAKEFIIEEKVISRRIVISEELRNKVYEKSNSMCVECKSTVRLEIDHIKPFSFGGETRIENLQLLCKSCNLIKSNKYGK